MSDLQALQGKWKITALQVDGNQMPASMLPPNAQIHIDGDIWSTQGMGAPHKGRVTLGEGAHKTISLVFTEGPENGNTNYGIYELNGDAWRVCINMSGGPAPAAFATAPGSHCALEDLVRL